MNLYRKHTKELTDKDFDKFGFALKRIELEETQFEKDVLKIIFYTKKPISNLDIYYGEFIPNNYAVYKISIDKDLEVEEIKNSILGKDVLEVAKILLETFPKQSVQIVKGVPSSITLNGENVADIVSCLPFNDEILENCTYILSNKKRVSNQVAHLL